MLKEDKRKYRCKLNYIKSKQGNVQLNFVVLINTNSLKFALSNYLFKQLVFLLLSSMNADNH